jgi:hypothetical protein
MPAFPRITVAAAAVLALLFAGGGAAQTIRGRVVDEVDGRPLPAAAVLLTDMEGRVRTVTRSGRDGEYQLRSTPGDTVRVRVERYGYQAMQSAPWTLAAGGVLEMEIRLRPEDEGTVVTLDTLTVRATTWRTRNRAQFERRRGMEAWGSFVDATRLSRIRSPRASDRLSFFIPGLQVSPTGVLMARGRGAALNGSTGCQPRLIVDGTRYPGDLPIDGLVAGDAIRAVEYYPDPDKAPGEFALGYESVLADAADPTATWGTRDFVMRKPCAIVVIWTDYGFGDAR